MAAEELIEPLEMLPPVEFCCAYGSFLLPNTDNKARSVCHLEILLQIFSLDLFLTPLFDFTDSSAVRDGGLHLGRLRSYSMALRGEIISCDADPYIYNSSICDILSDFDQNLERNRRHYSSWMALLGPQMVRFWDLSFIRIGALRCLNSAGNFSFLL